MHWCTAGKKEYCLMGLVKKKNSLMIKTTAVTINTFQMSCCDLMTLL